MQSIQLTSVPEESRRQISKELKINYSLNHTSPCSHIVAYYQSFYDNGVISLVLEYMDGGSLADFLQKVKSIPEPYLSAICQQVGPHLISHHHRPFPSNRTGIFLLRCRYSGVWPASTMRSTSSTVT